MKGHDVRRTGQSGSAGPVAVDRDRSWSVPVPGANVINIGASVDRNGVYFGSWGIQRNTQGSDDRAKWDKYDGSVYGYSLGGVPPLGRWTGRPRPGSPMHSGAPLANWKEAIQRFQQTLRAVTSESAAPQSIAMQHFRF
jgi:hypothetical protein